MVSPPPFPSHPLLLRTSFFGFPNPLARKKNSPRVRENDAQDTIDDKHAAPQPQPPPAEDARTDARKNYEQHIRNKL